MSEANSYAGTVGAWVAGFLVSFTQSVLTYIAFRKGWSHKTTLTLDDNTKDLLTDLNYEVRLLREAIGEPVMDHRRIQRTPLSRRKTMLEACSLQDECPIPVLRTKTQHIPSRCEGATLNPLGTVRRV